METQIGVQVELDTPESFLLCKETLTRIGVASRKDKKLYQSAHILHKKGMYYIVHFKSLFLLDGKSCSITEEDILRRNLIAYLLHDWGLLTIVDMNDVKERSPLGSVKVISFKDKENWTFVKKYSLGSGR